MLARFGCRASVLATQVSALPVSGVLSTPFRASTTSHKHNKTHRAVARKALKRQVRLEARAGSSQFDMFEKVTIREFRRYASTCCASRSTTTPT
jgi:hypothetical protein